jgi:predicted ArsR family transcriptional regulator
MLLHLRPIPFVQWLHNKLKLGYIASTPEKIYLKVLIMLTIEQIKKRLEDANLKRVAENAGVHPATVYRFMQDDSKPLYETVKALSDYLSDKEFANG